MPVVSHRARIALLAAGAAVCAAGIALFFVPAVTALGGGWDFLPVYTGAKLAGTPDLYNPAVQERTQALVPHPTTFSLPFMRLPFVAALTWPLAMLPYDAAHTAWMVLRVLAIVGFVLLWPHTPRLLSAIACAWFVPLAGAIANGQDSPFLLLWIAISERLRERRPFAAGLVLALCLAKFHLFVLLPVYLWIHRRNLIPGFLAGCGALAALSFAAAGVAWPAAYLAILKLPQSNPAVPMPNLHALLLPMPLEIALSAAVFLAAAFGIRRLPESWALAVTLGAGILLSYHAYFADLTLLLPALLALTPRRQAPVFSPQPAATPN